MIEGKGINGVEFGGNREKGRKPVLSVEIFGKGRNGLDGNAAYNVRLFGMNKDRMSSQEKTDRTIQLTEALQNISKLQETGKIKGDQADKYSEDILKELNKLQKNEPLFTGVVPTALRGMRTVYRWSAEKGLKQWEKKLDKQETADSTDTTRLTDPTWDDHLFSNNKFKRNKDFATTSGLASEPQVLDTKTGKFVDRNSTDTTLPAGLASLPETLTDLGRYSQAVPAKNSSEATTNRTASTDESPVLDSLTAQMWEAARGGKPNSTGKPDASGSTASGTGA